MAQGQGGRHAVVRPLERALARVVQVERLLDLNALVPHVLEERRVHRRFRVRRRADRHEMSL